MTKIEAYNKMIENYSVSNPNLSPNSLFLMDNLIIYDENGDEAESTWDALSDKSLWETGWFIVKDKNLISEARLKVEYAEDRVGTIPYIEDNKNISPVLIDTIEDVFNSIYVEEKEVVAINEDDFDIVDNKTSKRRILEKNINNIIIIGSIISIISVICILVARAIIGDSIDFTTLLMLISVLVFETILEVVIVLLKRRLHKYDLDDEEDM